MPQGKPRYLDGRGYVTRLALNQDDEIIGYEFINLGKMMDAIKKGEEPAEAMKKHRVTTDSLKAAAKYIDPRHE